LILNFSPDLNLFSKTTINIFRIIDVLNAKNVIVRLLLISGQEPVLSLP